MILLSREDRLDQVDLLFFNCFLCWLMLCDFFFFFFAGEDALFKQASQLARKEGIPRLYVSANAGARIGLADEMLREFQVAWKDENDPSKGFDYLYLTRERAAKMKDSVKVSFTGFLLLLFFFFSLLFYKKKKKVREVAAHPDRMEITDIIGKQHGIGVENLQGSGLIAGETSLAYRETFTLTVVTGRSVGIGA
jgi:acetyl-CoA carboxylase/biotin carboxylase 1